MQLIVTGTLANLQDGTHAMNTTAKASDQEGIASVTQSGTTAIYRVAGKNASHVIWILLGINNAGTATIGAEIWETGMTAVTAFPKRLQVTVA